MDDVKNNKKKKKKHNHTNLKNLTPSNDYPINLPNIKISIKKYKTSEKTISTVIFYI